MGRKSTIIDLSAEDREYLEAQTRACTIQAQTVLISGIMDLINTFYGGQLCQHYLIV